MQGGGSSGSFMLSELPEPPIPVSEIGPIPPPPMFSSPSPIPTRLSPPPPQPSSDHDYDYEGKKFSSGIVICVFMRTFLFINNLFVTIMS